MDETIRERIEWLRETLAPVEHEEIEETVTTLIEVFGRAYAIDVLRTFALSNEPWRFSDLEAELDAPPSTLSARLAEFEAAGLIDRHAYGEMPPRVEYEPTEKVRELFPAVGYLHWWASRHDLDTSDGRKA